MQRRDLLKTLAAGGILTAVAPPSRSTAGKPWKTAIGLNGFASVAGKYNQLHPLWEILDFASNAGFDGVELVEDWPMGGYPAAEETDRIRALRRLYDGFGLQIFSIQNSVAAAFDPDPAVRKTWLKQFENRARFARAVGCECLGMWPGGGLRWQTIEEAPQPACRIVSRRGRHRRRPRSYPRVRNRAAFRFQHRGAHAGHLGKSQSSRAQGDLRSQPFRSDEQFIRKTA
ncbi:MAG: TIM barrel protein [Candidatus Omnitrophica bacterium]|nr:TIM barrel protein [Candidatus Omnitrophota bacterium]